jgi:hypothetical protein
MERARCPQCGQRLPSLTSRPRTTGPKSQCNHLHGHLQLLAQETGYTMGEMKDVMKEDCPFWPQKVVRVGKRTQTVYASEADVDTETEAAAIEWCHVRAAELGIVLREE